jgi:hypothetical protein
MNTYARRAVPERTLIKLVANFTSPRLHAIAAQAPDRGTLK